MTTAQQPRGAHLVGSVPLQDSEEVFRTASEVMGKQLQRIPDGETGERSVWIQYQIGFFANNPALEPSPTGASRTSGRAQLRVREGVAPEDIKFEDIGYSSVALKSYQTFARLKSEGVIPDHIRFQVSLPTPLASILSYVVTSDYLKLEPAYQKRMLAEADEIAAAIPHDQLAMQWDVAVEIGVLEGVIPSPFADTKAAIMDRLTSLGDHVPSDIEMGYHLCYGDYGHKHFKEPEDTSLLVEIMNTLAERVQRQINWFHIPVPRSRTDQSYFEPLRELKLKPGTELYLGLVHLSDGVEGTRQRIATAQNVITDFGVATECGFGRRPADTVVPLMQIHAATAAPVE